MSSRKKLKLSKSVSLKVTTYSVSSTAVKRRSGFERITFQTARPADASSSSTVAATTASVYNLEINLERTGKRETSYRAKKVVEIEEWAKALDEMVIAAVDSNAPTSFLCAECGVEVDNVVRCVDCGPYGYYCTDCEKNVHRGRLHRPEIWKVRHYFIKYMYIVLMYYVAQMIST